MGLRLLYGPPLGEIDVPDRLTAEWARALQDRYGAKPCSDGLARGIALIDGGATALPDLLSALIKSDREWLKAALSGYRYGYGYGYGDGYGYGTGDGDGDGYGHGHGDGDGYGDGDG